jgi:hypothetical protein
MAHHLRDDVFQYYEVLRADNLRNDIFRQIKRDAAARDGDRDVFVWRCRRVLGAGKFFTEVALQRYLMIFDNHIPQPFFTVGQVSPMIAMLYPYNLINQRL